ncbi:hypothetical protein BGX31_004834 [Mortierella sp. GBA43]|nr:hypothetical protein BGX31_004834 [Mortierella sp. GBA43]
MIRGARSRVTSEGRSEGTVPRCNARSSDRHYGAGKSALEDNDQPGTSRKRTRTTAEDEYEAKSPPRGRRESTGTAKPTDLYLTMSDDDGISEWKAWCANMNADRTECVTHDKMLDFMDHHVRMKERRMLGKPDHVSVIDTYVKPVLELWKTQSLASVSPGASNVQLDDLLSSITARSMALDLDTDLPTPQSSQSSNFDMEAGLYNMRLNSGYNRYNSGGSAQMAALDPTIVSYLHQAQEETRRSGHISGLLMNPKLVEVFESLLKLVESLLRSQVHRFQPELQQHTPNPFTTEQLHHAHVSEPAAVTPCPTVRTLKKSLSNLSSSPGGWSPDSSPRSANSNSGGDRIENPQPLDDQPIYPCNPEVKSAQDIWKEWNDGWNGGPSLKSMIKDGQMKYLQAKEPPVYLRRYRAIRARITIAQSMEEAIGSNEMTEQQAFTCMEIFRNGRKPWTMVSKENFEDWKKGEPPVDRRKMMGRKMKRRRKKAASRKNRKVADNDGKGDDDAKVDETEDDSDADYVDDQESDEDDDEDDHVDVDDDEDDDDDDYVDPGSEYSDEDDEDDEDEGSDEYRRGGGEGDLDLNDIGSDDETSADPDSPAAATGSEDAVMEDVGPLSRSSQRPASTKLR